MFRMYPQREEDQIAILMNNLCDSIKTYNILMLNTTAVSVILTAYFNPIMAGRLGKDMDELKTIKVTVGSIFERLGGLLRSRESKERVRDHVQTVLNSCHKTTVRSIEKEFSTFLSKIRLEQKDEDMSNSSLEHRM